MAANTGGTADFSSCFQKQDFFIDLEIHYGGIMSFKELNKQSVADNEKQISNYWDSIDILKRSIENRTGKENFVFFEGPPTANGKPGIHHVLARTLKDSVNKYKVMQGYRVLRKAGWDTHGLPVEIEVEKTLGMSGKQDIEKYGIKEFNEKCRASVFSYEAMWREMTKRMAYFIDLDDPYITLDNNYIETVWWILDQYFKKGLIYEGHKILPYCPRCGTGLASHEVSLGYQMIKTDTVIVEMKAKQSDYYFLVWTTTPWTLASNVALAVNPQADYAKVIHNGKKYVAAKALLGKLFGDEYEILEEMDGKSLEFTEYEQLMPFIKPQNGKAFFVTCAEYVTMEDGTGIVHIAPAFGEDDYQVGKKYGLAVPNPVDESGHYLDTPWKGQFVMDADKDIIIWLKEQGKLFKKIKMEHNYPHCWRCKTPLLYYAKPSWYIEVTKYKDQLIAANSEVEWYPDFVGEKRFGNWLENLKDWAISRNRYWGTPLNIWRCECGHTESIGSREELVSKALEPIDASVELHRPYVDEVHIECPICKKKMTRVTDVIDCWFDSGSMPFAQYHFPFEKKDIFEDQFPADFICEGIDQTRGWFYSLLAIGTFLTGKSPYKRVLVNDLILDKDGLKMSKSRGNTVDPFAMFDQYGADALRWYLLYVSPAWTPTKFDEEGLKEVISKYFLTLKNVYSFFVMYANADQIDPRNFDCPISKRDEIDRWLLSKYHSMLKEVTENMDAFDMTKAVRKIQEFVNEDLSNWYIRRNRKRFWDSQLTDDKKAVYLTTYEILVGIAKISAPFAPYITEEIYRNLTDAESVHLADYPKYDELLIDSELEYKMDLVRDLVSLGRSAREEVQIKVRQPLSEILIDGAHEKPIGELTELIKEELNVKEIIFENDLSKYMNFSLKPDFRACGKLFGSLMKPLSSKLAEIDAAEFVHQINAHGSADVIVEGQTLTLTKDLLDIRITAKEGFNVQTKDNLFIILSTELTAELVAEGYAREIVSKIQQTRKAIGLEITDHIDIVYDVDSELQNALQHFREYIMSETLADSLALEENNGEVIRLNGHEVTIQIKKH